MSKAVELIVDGLGFHSRRSGGRTKGGDAEDSEIGPNGAKFLLRESLDCVARSILDVVPIRESPLGNARPCNVEGEDGGKSSGVASSYTLRGHE